MRIQRRILLMLSMAVFLTGATTLTASTTGTMTVNASISTTCSIVNVVFDFGQIATDTDKKTNGNLSINCTAGLLYGIDLDNGLYYFNGTRQMASNFGSGDGRLAYSIFSDSGYSQPWGSTVPGGSALTGQIGTGSIKSFPVYLLVPAQPARPSGNYSDQVTITATF